MRDRLRVVLPLVLCGLLVGAPPVSALWVDDGTGICTATGDQQYPAVTCDGAGGTIIAWLDERVAGWPGIFAQRVSASGTIEWTANGIGIRTGVEYELVYAPAIAPDGVGGAVIAWYESRGGGAGFDIYAQRVSASGDLLWTTNGVAICTAAGNQEYPAIVPDGSGGMIIVWNDQRVSNWNIYAQRVDASGAVQWTTDGVAVCAAAGNRLDLVATSDAAGGVIVSWWDDRSGNPDVYVQRIDASGTVRWSPQGVALCTAPGGKQGPSQIASDGAGGAIVTWCDIRGGSPDVYAQRVNASGAVQWATNGVAICTSVGAQYWPVIVSDDAGGAIIAWDDSRDGDCNVYAQRVNASGSVQWAGNGVLLCSAPGDQYTAAIVTDGASGAIVAWHDLRGGSGLDPYAQRVNGLGETQWAVDGIPICTAPGDQSFSSSSMVSDGAGGAIVAWNDQRAGNLDVYAKRLCGEGDCVGWPRITAVRDVPRDQGGKLRVQWARSDFDYRFTEITHYSVWRRLSELAAVALESGDVILRMPLVPIDYAGPALRRSSGGYSWEWIANVPARYFDSYSLLVTSLYDSMGVDPGWQYFMVTAQTATQYIFYDSPVDSGYSVDNLAPHSPSGLAGEQVFAPEGLALVWDMNAESDFSRYAVYRGTSEYFVPGAENRLAEVTASNYFDGDWRWDGGFYYKVSAVDIHGNESTYAPLSPDAVTGNDTPGAPDATYLAQNFPNPFNPTTRITFGLRGSTMVSLRIYDVAGRLVRVLMEGDRPAGRYAELWNGCDAVGNSAASGMYFYRLDAGSFTQTRKMILLR